MKDVADRALETLYGLNKDLWAKASVDPGIHQSVKTNIYMHLTSPWIPGFLGYVITPLRNGLDTFLGRTVLQYGSQTWYYPSLDWMFAHADRSHAKSGSGCDEAVHEAFLTAGGSDAEFGYAAVLKNGSIKVLGRPDFDMECAFWVSGIKG